VIPRKSQTKCLKTAGLLSVILTAWLAASAPAAPVRVVTWNLQPRDAAAGAADDTSQQAAKVLKELNPDVIILEQVPDLLSCEDLLQALKPADYEVAVFSSFRDRQTGELSRQQVAILSREKSTNPSWEMWLGGDATAAPGGFACAVIHLEDRNLGVFAVQLSDATPPDERARDSAAQQAARETATRELVQQIDALRDSPNAVQALVVGGDFNTTPDDPKLSREMTLVRLEHAGFSNVIASLPPGKRVTLPGNGKRPDATVDYLFTSEVPRVANVRIVPASISLHNPVAGDLSFEVPAAVQAAVPAPPAPPMPTAPVQAATPPPPVGEHSAAGPAVSADAVPQAADVSSPSADMPPSLAEFWQTLVKEIGLENIRWLEGLLAGGIILTAAGFRLLARRSHEAARLAASGAGEVLVMAPLAQTGSAAEITPVVRIQAPAPADAQSWQRRAEEAERRADQATDAVRRGVVGHLSQWLKGGLARRLVSDRAQLLEAQRMAALKIQVVDERLTKVEQHIQQRTREYEARIGDLEKELAEAKEENRELIREKIAQVRAEMERERARLLQHARVNA
jgi:endonuclease/exonuclease/phosphatase family metal-dependent hydrolase